MRRSIADRRNSVRCPPPDSVYSAGCYSDDPKAWREGIQFFRSLGEIVALTIVVLGVLVLWVACRMLPRD